MSRSKNRGHKESLKPRLEAPEIPDLGRLSKPRKTNRATARYIAEKGPLWDRRRVERKARKRALTLADAMSQNPRRQHLTKSVRVALLKQATDWVFDPKTKSLTPETSIANVEQLIDALGATDLTETPVVRVAGLTAKETARVRGYLDSSTKLVVVKPYLS